MAKDLKDVALKALYAAAEVVEHFERATKRQPTEAELKLALTFFIQAQRNGKANGNGKSQASAPAGDVPRCPKCGGEMFDNRGRKKSPKAPDFRCKDENCVDESGYRTAVWADREKKAAPKREPAPAAAPAAKPWEDPDDPLPF